MRLILLSIVFLGHIVITYGQHVEETYPKKLWCPNDTFHLKFTGSPKLHAYCVSHQDQGSPGMSAFPNAFVTIFYGTDSLRLSYHNNIPYAHIIFVNFESPQGKTRLRVHFDDRSCWFSGEYMDKNRDNVQFDIPEAYELANIIWMFSPSGSRAKDLNREGTYYERVVRHFRPYLQHPVFKVLDFPDSVAPMKYLDFRENSFAFNFQDRTPGSANTLLLYNGPYYYVFGQELADSSLFGKLKPLIEDFARKSKFRQFYKNNLEYYQKAVAREKELLPVRVMWNWLEKEFPKYKFHSYRVVFSPLVNSTHSTQLYFMRCKNEWFSEVAMFICGPDRVDKLPELNGKQREGLMSGILLTEIDHNYINPVAGQHRTAVESIFIDRSNWTRKGSSADFYSSCESVFNEYMTHAVYCLYVLEVYEKPVADFLIEKREQMMVDGRGFIRFREFDQELIRLRQTHKGGKVVDLYPAILEWCSKQQ